jgi:DNA-binding PadR family transcriptional regulator
MTGAVWGIAEMRVLALLCGGQHLHAYAVAKVTGVEAGNVYKILQRLQAHGLVNGTTERVEPHISARVPKVFYGVTTAGRDQMSALRTLVQAST